MSHFTVFDNTGKLIRTGFCPDFMINAQASAQGENVINQAAVLDTQYIADINNPVLTDRPANPATIDKTTVAGDGIDVVVFSNLPDSAEMTVKATGVNIKHSPAGSSESVDFDLPGSYTVSVHAFPYLDYEVTINAT